MRWAFATGDVGALDDEPVALVLPLVGTAHTLADARQRSLWRRQTLSVLAAAALGAAGNAIGLVIGADGRRRLAGTDVFASVAHRAGWVAAVLGRAPVGIDLEEVSGAAQAAEVILAGISPMIDLAAWHGYAGMWAAREAALKAQGRDLTQDHQRWRFGVGTIQGGVGTIQGGDGPTLRADLVARASIVAAVAYAGG